MFRRFFTLAFAASLLISGCGPAPRHATSFEMTLTAIPTPLAGTLPKMLAYPEEGSCPPNTFMNDRVSHLWFCSKWVKYNNLAHFYYIDGLEYNLVLRPSGNVVLVTLDYVEQLTPTVEAQEIYFLNKDGSHWGGPIYIILINGELFLDEQFKDVIRTAPKGKMQG